MVLAIAKGKLSLGLGVVPFHLAYASQPFAVIVELELGVGRIVIDARVLEVAAL